MKLYHSIWLIFFLLVLIFLIPTLGYFKSGIPEYLNRTTFLSRFWFVAHIISGLLVFALAPFQFSAAYKKRNYTQHRKLGKLYIFLSLLCILTLLVSILPKSLCESCKISQYMVTSLWLGFIIAAYVSIISKRIILHKRLMISAFICASYFVTVRIIALTSMGFFNYLTKNESQAYFISDLAVWACATCDHLDKLVISKFKSKEISSKQNSK
ncbi:DUF2306 domain-containing protein [Paucihalobacter sp.]|uniref:DUF2306 domain-containing protein n=1 Tax=Paucihalobacter sp. TaxID=2850405 RepID=UPI003D1617E7